MSRYIDADNLKERIPKDIHEDVFENCSNCELLNDEQVKELIDLQPTADVRENVRGEWIRRDSRYVGWISFDCSVCGETLELDRETSNDFKYCPFCGAEMRGDNNV